MYFFLFLVKKLHFTPYGSLLHKTILSVSGSRFIRLCNIFVSPDPEPPIINILYKWSEISGQFG